jgi:hypothetical protein
MKLLNLITQILIVVGGLNWGLIGFLNWNLVAALFGESSVLSQIVYMLVGVSALWQLIQLFGTFKTGGITHSTEHVMHGQ